MMKARTAARVAAALGVAGAAVACSSSPEQTDPTETGSSAAVQAISGSLDEWQDAVCKDGDATTGTNTRHTVDGSNCVPADGDGSINFDHFDSESSMDMVLSWADSRYAADTVVDGRPMVIWTPAGESSDLEPLKKFGFSVAPAGFVQQTLDSLPQALNPSLPDPPAGAATLPANQYGYVVIQTASGQIQCMIETTYVGCQTAGTQWPARLGGGGQYHGVKINADGTARWVDGNLGADAPVTLGNQTYQALGWTVTSSNANLRFTNDATGHGAIVSEQGVQRF